MSIPTLPLLLSISLLLTARLPLSADSQPDYGSAPMQWSIRMADSEMARLGNTLCYVKKDKSGE